MPAEHPAPSANFIRSIVEADLAEGAYQQRRWAGRPGPAPVHAAAPADPARIRTRFPPEPNGHLHYGHAKSIFLNFGLARDYGGACHLRFDDTNPAKEEQEYVDAIIEDVHWLGFDWGENLYYASDYFDWLYEFAEALILAGFAYVDSLSADEIREYRGTLTEKGRNSPYRERAPAESLELFRRMKAGDFPDGAHVLRLKIDMGSPNINLRDPIAYRVRHASHHRTGDKWCIYPMYDFTHGISDALENITHSVCTLEFEDHRPLYDWLNEKLGGMGLLNLPLPRQYEFSRLNLTYVVLSKRKLIQLVEEGHTEGWDDPRMPTLAGARRRGFTPAGFRRFAERIGVSKSDSWIDISLLEDCMREDLNERAPRRIAVLDPIRLVIDNYPDDRIETCHAPNHPLLPELGSRELGFSKELWIERDDYMEVPAKGYRRLFPGNTVRLRYAFVVKCLGAEYDDQGRLIAAHCEYFPDSKSGTPGADSYKVKGNLHWVSSQHAFPAQVRLYDRLFLRPNPGLDADAQEHDFLDDLNPDSKRVVTGYLESALAGARVEEHFQFERHGYFVADRYDSSDGQPVFNRTVTLKDSWTKSGAG